LARVLPNVHVNEESAADSGPTTGPDNAGKSADRGHLREILLELSHRGVLNYDIKNDTVGFPLPPSPSSKVNDASKIISKSEVAASDSVVPIPQPPSKLVGKGLHGSTEPSAKRRMKVLEWSMQNFPSLVLYGNNVTNSEQSKVDSTGEMRGASEMHVAAKKHQGGCLLGNKDNEVTNHAIESQQYTCSEDERLDDCIERKAAYQALDSLLAGTSSSLYDSKDCTISNFHFPTTKKQWLPCQAAYAGTQSGRDARYEYLSKETASKIPPTILQLFNLNCSDSSSSTDTESSGKSKRRLYLHQARAIESAMNNVHTVVQTATGSGKSLCFLLPVLAKAIQSIESGERSSAILLFPTKALAQDQFTKINALLKSLSSSNDTDDCPVRAGVLDGDTAHSQRDAIASECQIILTNPDTLHAAILPNWNKRPAYQHLLARLTTVVVDEAHVYEGAFGAHVAMVLARLIRVCRVASSPSNTDNVTQARKVSFIACSATMLHPEKHFRLLCPISEDENVRVLTSENDGSPCSAKHFFVWNPPILDVDGNSTNSVFLPKRKGCCGDCKIDEALKNDVDGHCVSIPIGSRKRKKTRYTYEDPALEQLGSHQITNIFNRRRHAADETAFLLAKAISAGVRTIAFCRTRSLVEWVYEKTLSILQSDSKTCELTSKVESYRGGYTMESRRSIEDRLFHRKLLGVVGTCALELGVDVGGVDLTLHTGYPGSISSLLQQSGRAGRGKDNHSVASCAIMICFSAPSEQHIWRNPTTLLSRGLDVPPNLPFNDSVIQGHLLCAGNEFPLTGDRSVSSILNEDSKQEHCPVDCVLLGPSNIYYDNVEYLARKGLLSQKFLRIDSHHHGVSKSRGSSSISVYSTHPVSVLILSQ
jgi:DEAD/DEAH box helicase domain-containing protein